MNKFRSIEKEIATVAQRWESIAITFSGGKDSTALTFALLNAFEKANTNLRRYGFYMQIHLLNPLHFYKQPKKVWIFLRL